jgi:hypothetical protein
LRSNSHTVRPLAIVEVTPLHTPAKMSLASMIKGKFNKKAKKTQSQAPSPQLPDGLQDKRYIVGVDFGTSFTGFSILPIPKDGSTPIIITERNWPDAPPRYSFTFLIVRANSPKVPTLLNYHINNEREEVDAQDWGWSVDSAYPDANVIRFDRVKLYLSVSECSLISRWTRPPKVVSI